MAQSRNSKLGLNPWGCFSVFPNVTVFLHTVDSIKLNVRFTANINSESILGWTLSFNASVTRGLKIVSNVHKFKKMVSVFFP